MNVNVWGMGWLIFLLIVGAVILFYMLDAIRNHLKWIRHELQKLNEAQESKPEPPAKPAEPAKTKPKPPPDPRAKFRVHAVDADHHERDLIVKASDKSDAYAQARQQGYMVDSVEKI